MSSAELREGMGIESVSHAMKWNRLRWLGHVLWKDDDDWVKKIMSFEVWKVRENRKGQVVERDTRESWLKRERWMRLLYRVASQLLHKQGKQP